MARLQFRGRSMGGQESDLTRSLDDAVDIVIDSAII
jgi:hypothetical protein